METRTETQVRLVLEAQCREIGDRIAEACPAGTGFALFIYDFGDKGNVAYVANGERSDFIKMLKEWLARQEVAA